MNAQNEPFIHCNVGENSSFGDTGFENVQSELEGVQVNDSCVAKFLAWKLNLEMRHAVLPVTIFVGVEGIVGFVGNSLVLYVFFFRYPVSNFRYFVLSLACIDFVSTLTTLPGEIVTQLYWYVYPVPMFCKVKSFFNVFTVSAEALFLFTIAVDRYKKVCTPFGKQIKQQTAKILCALVYFTAFILALPASILWGTNTHTKTYENHRINVTVCEKDEYFVNTLYPVAYVISVQTVIIVCLIALLVLYILVAKRLVVCRPRRRLNSGTVVIFSKSNENVASVSVEQVDQDVLTDLALSSGSKYPSQRCVTLHNKAVQTCQHFQYLDIPKRIERHSDTSDEEHTGSAKPICLHQNFVKSPVRQRVADDARVRRKTLIMFILTIVFIITTILYLTLLAIIADSDDILQVMSDSGKATYFFFFRLVFINHVINPFIYGFLDRQFMSGLSDLKCGFLRFYRGRIRPN